MVPKTTETKTGMFLQVKRLTKMTKSWKHLDKYFHVEFVVFFFVAHAQHVSTGCLCRQSAAEQGAYIFLEGQKGVGQRLW